MATAIARTPEQCHAEEARQEKSRPLKRKVVLPALFIIGIVAGAIVHGKMQAHPRSSNIGFRS